MVVDEDERGGGGADGGAEHLARMDERRRQRPLRDLHLRLHAVLPVEENDVEHLPVELRQPPAEVIVHGDRVAHRTADGERHRDAPASELEHRPHERGPSRPETTERGVGGAIETVESFESAGGTDQARGERDARCGGRAGVEDDAEQLRIRARACARGEEPFPHAEWPGPAPRRRGGIRDRVHAPSRIAAPPGRRDT